MKYLLQSLRWDTLLIHRNRLFIIAIVVGLFYTGLFYLLKPLGNLSMVLILLIINDPIVTGFVFAGVLWIFDKQQHTLQAIAVLPLPLKDYFLSKAIILGVLGSLTALLMAFVTSGANFLVGHLFVSVFLGTFMFSCFGFTIAAIAGNFNRFLLYMIPCVIICGIPILFTLGIDRQIWRFVLPSTGMIELLEYSIIGRLDASVLLAYIQLVFWAVVSWFVMLAVTKKRVS